MPSARAATTLSPDELQRYHHHLILPGIGEAGQRALKASRAQISVAVSGVAGPDGGAPKKPVGTVCIAWCMSGAEPLARTHRFQGDRDSVRRQSVIAALEGLLVLVNGKAG